MINSKPKHGGARAGAGRPRTNNVAITIRVKPATERYIHSRLGLRKTRGQIVDEAFKAAIEAKELARMLS